MSKKTNNAVNLIFHFFIKIIIIVKPMVAMIFIGIKIGSGIGFNSTPPFCVINNVVSKSSVVNIIAKIIL